MWGLRERKHHLPCLAGAGPRPPAEPCTSRLQFLHRTSHSQQQITCHLENTVALLRASSHPGCLHQTYQQAPGHDSKPPATIRHLHPTWCKATHSSPLCQPPGSTAAITHCLGLETQGTLTHSLCPSPTLAEIITNLVRFTALSSPPGSRPPTLDVPFLLHPCF